MHFTQNPIGSADQLDLQDNSISFDYAMNSPAALWQDRFGKQHKTVQQALKDVGFKPAGFDFVSGGTLEIGDRDKCVFFPTDGYWYSWNGKLPYVVPVNSSPTPGGKKGWGVINKNSLCKVNVRDFGARSITEPGCENFDSSDAFLSAIATGKSVEFSGSFKFSKSLRQDKGKNFILIGDEGYNVAEGNGGANDLNFGSTLIWTGDDPDIIPINPSNFIGKKTITTKKFRLITTPSVKVAHQIDATEYNTITGEAAAVPEVGNIALLCTGFNQSPGGQINTAMRVIADNKSITERARFSFGWNYHDIYIFNFNQGLILSTPDGFINGNRFDGIKMYQVYRPLIAEAGDGHNSIYQNTFKDLQVQPGRIKVDGMYKFADGLLRYNKNFTSNVFINLALYDVDQTGISIVHTNPPGNVSSNLYLGAGDIPGDDRNIHNGLPGFFIRQDGNHKAKSLTLVDDTVNPIGIEMRAKNNVYHITSVPEGAGTRIIIKMDNIIKFSIGPSGIIKLSSVPNFLGNSAALAAGLLPGEVYRNGENLAVVY